jgi:hypothetical protein
MLTYGLNKSDQQHSYGSEAMDVEVVDVKTGKSFKATIVEPPASFFEFTGHSDLTGEQVKVMIDRLNVSADIKSMLHSFSSATITVGRSIVKIGRKIIDVLFSLVNHFPALSFGALFGLLVGALIASIPVIAALLGTLAITIGLAFGIAIGAKHELGKDDLGDRVNSFIKELGALAA